MKNEIEKDNSYYTFILPITVIIFDYDYRRVAKRAELKKILVLKVLAWLFFYAAYIAAFVRPHNRKLVDFVNLILVVYPIAACMYSFLL